MTAVSLMNRRKRQLILFLVAVMLPAGVLSALALRFLRQDEELGRQRATEEYTNAVNGVRRELTARLNAIKLEGWNRGDSAIIFAARWNRDGLILPWLHAPESVHPAGEFIAMLDRSTTLEFQSNDLAAAARAYQQALLLARRPEDACEARLGLGRVLVKAKQDQEALKVYLEMLAACGATVDDAGIPFSFYAANQMIDLRLDVPSATSYLVREATSGRLRPIAEATMIQTLLQNVDGDAVPLARQRLAEQIATIQRITAISEGFTKDLALELGRVRKLDETWFAEGPEPWLLTALPATSVSDPVFYAVSASKIAPPGTRLVAQHTAQSTPLGPGFTNVELEFDPPRNFSAGRVPATFYAVGLALIVSLAVFGGYMLLHGVNRDLEMAEMRSQFVASVSHELRTPLTAIRMFAETLILGRTGSEIARAEYLETIVSESERLARLVDNVLDFSKIEQGKKIYRMSPASLEEVVHSAARAMQYPLSQQGFTLDISVDDDISLLPLDADAMEQAILNLLSNAMKYSGAARRIALRLERDRNNAFVRVIDRGIGISSVDLQHIFDKFYRVQSDRTHLIAGTGLGLTLVKHIAESHGGDVDVQSVVGSGSTFTIRIPLSVAEVRS
jgi:signal transduction histidine kinase